MKTDPKLAAARRAQLKALTTGRLTQTQLAELSGIKLPQIGQWLSGDRNMSEGSARKIEKSLRLAVGWLDTASSTPDGTGSSDEPRSTEDRSQRNELEAGPTMRSRVPLIQWEEVGSFNAVSNRVQPGATTEWIATSEQPTADAFALRVVGDAMSPQFPPGSILIVEPSAVPEAGDYVIAKDSNGEPVFRQLVRDGSRWFLRAMHPSYPTYDAQLDQILGVVVEVNRRLKAGS